MIVPHDAYGKTFNGPAAVMTVPQLDMLAECSPAPTAILETSGAVVAANQGAGRLLSPVSRNNPNSLIGRPIFDFDVSVVPGKKPVHRTLDALLKAASSRLRQSSSEDVPMEECSIYRLSVEQPTDDEPAAESDFWDDEDAMSTAQEIDVMIPRRKPLAKTQRPADQQEQPVVSSIRARMSVQAFLLNDQTFFRTTFRRSTSDYLHFIPALQNKGLIERQISPKPMARASSDVLEDLKGSSNHGGLCEQIIGRLIPHCAGILDSDGQVLYLSPSWYDLIGITEAQSLGTEWVQVIHPDDREAMLLAFSDIMEQREEWTYEARYRMRDGEFRYFLVRARPFLDGVGEVQRWYTTMLDVNDAVIDRQEKEQRRQAMLNLLSQADVSLWGVNQAYEMYVRAGALAWEPTRSLPQNSMDSNGDARDESITNKPDPDGNSVESVIQSILEGQLSLKTMEHQVDDRWYRTRIVADLDQQHDHNNSAQVVRAALGLTIDVTDVKVRAALEVENERLLTSAAKEASRLKSQFLANMSHEIRTPIAGIIGLAELLAEPGKESERQELLSGIQQSASFLLMLINDILDFSKIESGHMDIEAVPFQPTRVIEDLRVLMGVQARDKGLKLVSHNSLPRDMSIVGDPGRLRQILTNLLSNSIKFTTKGSVVMSVQILSDDEDDILPDFEEGKGKTTLQFVVEDNGCGISDESMRKLFQPFSQADASTARTHGGTGLGLSISRQLVELMGGTITLKSSPNAGTVATVKIPYPTATSDKGADIQLTTARLRKSLPDTNGASSDHRDDTTNSFLAAQDSDHPNIHVLVVEDNPVNQKIAVAKVRKLGHSVSAVWNGSEALTYLDAVAATASNSNIDFNPPNTSSNGTTTATILPSIVLMDCMMPVMDGYEATQVLRRDEQRFGQALRGVPVIAMTASAVQGERKKCEEAGMDDYLTKPVTQEVLEQMIQKWVLKRKRLSAQSAQKVNMD